MFFSLFFLQVQKYQILYEKALYQWRCFLPAVKPSLWWAIWQLCQVNCTELLTVNDSSRYYIKNPSLTLILYYPP